MTITQADDAQQPLASDGEYRPLVPCFRYSPRLKWSISPKIELIFSIDSMLRALLLKRLPIISNTCTLNALRGFVGS
jgi:hypothetical protein